MTAENRFRDRSGVPREVDHRQPWPKRFLTDPRTWLTLALLVLYAVCLVQLYIAVVPDREVPGGTILGLGHEAVPKAAKYAAISLIPLTLAFAWLDRFRPQGVWLWLLALGWGGCVATYLSLLVNSWAASHLAILGDGDPASADRAAIYVAPFVEEVTKATVLFGVAFLLRYRFVSRITGIALAGLSGAGFAFTENIIYYGRAYRYAAQTFGQADPEEVLQYLFQLRGLMLFYGHPLFTIMTGIGLAIGVRHKSKVVRVVAPLAGFLAAALGHMAFNTTATLVTGPALLMMWAVSLLIVLSGVIAIVRMLFAEGRLIRDRLTDYTRAGWLPEGYPAAYSRLRTRLRCLWQALWAGPRTLWATLQTQRAVTELAYLRDAVTRGLVDTAAHGRERELFARIMATRPMSVDLPRPKTVYPTLPWRRRPAVQTGYPSYPDTDWAPPAQVPAMSGSAPLGSTGTRYSEVNPTWKPPS